MDLGLTGRIALVVGGDGYLGRAVAARLREEGATVVTAGRSNGDVHLDAGDDASVAKAVDEVLAEHGRIDVLVVSAAPPANLLDSAKQGDPAAVLAGIDGKAMVFLRVAQAVLPHMRAAGAGRVIGVAGQNAYLTGSIVGSARNTVLLVAAKNLADEHAGTGVTVNVVNPGPVVDEPGGDIGRAAPGPSSPEQIAALVAFLASGFGAAISGESISTGHKLRGIDAL